MEQQNNTMVTHRALSNGSTSAILIAKGFDLEVRVDVGRCVARA